MLAIANQCPGRRISSDMLSKGPLGPFPLGESSEEIDMKMVPVHELTGYLSTLRSLDADHIRHVESMVSSQVTHANLVQSTAILARAMLELIQPAEAATKDGILTRACCATATLQQIARHFGEKLVWNETVAILCEAICLGWVTVEDRPTAMFLARALAGITFDDKIEDEKQGHAAFSRIFKKVLGTDGQKLPVLPQLTGSRMVELCEACKNPDQAPAFAVVHNTLGKRFPEMMAGIYRKHQQ